MVMVVVFEFSVMRCQPLRRALVSINQKSSKSKLICIKHAAFSIHFHKLAFESLPDADFVESVESSAVSTLLKTNKPRSFNVVGYSTRSA